MKILVVDDERSILDTVKAMLEPYDCEVDCANDAQTAVDMAGAKTYDFVLFDYRMPDKDGLWFLKNAKLPRETKALLMTAFGTRDLINRSFQLGAAGYLLKPFGENDLLRHLQFHQNRKTVAC